MKSSPIPFFANPSFATAFFAFCILLSPPLSAQTTEAAVDDPQATTGTETIIDTQGNPHTISSHLPEPPARDHRAAFDAIDVDGNGRIGRAEAAGDKYLARAFDSLDRDGSGGLDFEEMLAWLDD